jgi:hypothetical protein
MKSNRTALIVILSAFALHLFFTAGMPFFWEDFIYLGLDKDITPLVPSAHLTLSQLISLGAYFLDAVCAPGRIFSIGFGAADRPMQYIIWNILPVCFGANAFFYHVLKAAAFAINCGMMFILIRAVSPLLALGGALLYMTTVEFWFTECYISDVGIFMQSAVLACVYFFLKLIKKYPIKRFTLACYYLLIFFFCEFAILSKGDGRYLAAIFLIVVLIYKKQPIKAHVTVFSLLFLLHIPVLGFIRKALTRSDITPINIGAHNPHPLPEAVLLIIKNYRYPVQAIGVLVLFCGLCLVCIHIVRSVFIRKEKAPEAPAALLLPEKLVLFALWFGASFSMMAMSRSFDYTGPSDWLLMDCSYFIAPFILFLTHYSYFVASKFQTRASKAILYACLALFIAQAAAINLPRYNRLRGGWGGYFCSWKNAGEKIATLSDNALIFTISTMDYKPFVTPHTGVSIINVLGAGQDRVTDYSFIKAKLDQARYRDIFIVATDELAFRGDASQVSLKGSLQVPGNCGGAYDCMKQSMGKPATNSCFIYQFTEKNE